MSAVAVGLLVEEQRREIAEAWRRSVEEEIGGDPAIGFAVGPLLRELSLSLRGDRPARQPGPARSTGATPEDGLQRIAVLVRSGAQPARAAREFKLLRRALWGALRRAGRIVAAEERREADEWLDEALAACLDRLERVRLRIDLLERGPAVVPARPAQVIAPARRPPPLPSQRAAGQRPPPLPPSAAHPGHE